jgi:hypothetical protein
MATVVSEVPPSDATGLIAEFSGMTPSASSLDLFCLQNSLPVK